MYLNNTHLEAHHRKPHPNNGRSGVAPALKENQVQITLNRTPRDPKTAARPETGQAPRGPTGGEARRGPPEGSKAHRGPTGGKPDRTAVWGRMGAMHAGQRYGFRVLTGDPRYGQERPPCLAQSRSEVGAAMAAEQILARDFNPQSRDGGDKVRRRKTGREGTGKT